MLSIRTQSILPLAQLALCVACANAVGQSASPSFATSELERLRGNAIGQGYTADSINAQALIGARPLVGIQGVGSGGVVTSSLGRNSGGSPRKAATFDSFGGRTTSSKPFSSVSSSPTISPYLNLFRQNLDDNTDNYNTLVRPQLQQQQINQNFQREAQAITRHVQSLSAKPAFNPQGSEQYLPTGHPTGFMNYSHFYPSASTRRPRQ